MRKINIFKWSMPVLSLSLIQVGLTTYIFDNKTVVSPTESPEMKDSKIESIEVSKEITYWLSNLVWGSEEYLIGLIAFIVCLCLKCPVDIYKGAIRVNIGNRTNGGCFGLGKFIFVNSDGSEICDHEFGHCIQNAIWGPYKMYVVTIPSIIHYWSCEFSGDWNGYHDLWFEKNATSLGRSFAWNYQTPQTNSNENKQYFSTSLSYKNLNLNSNFIPIINIKDYI